MKAKDSLTGIGIVLAVVAAAVYLSGRDGSPESQLGPPSNIAGPNAETDQCKDINQEQGSLLDRQSNEDTQAETLDGKAFDQIMQSHMTDAERQIAINNLSAKGDMAKTAREARQMNEEVQLQAKAQDAGCLIPK